MSKLKLEIDELRVESFETDIPQGRGTVVGAAKPPVGGGTYPNCSEIDACPSAWHCTIDPALCGDTVDKSCPGTCDFNSACGFC